MHGDEVAQPVEEIGQRVEVAVERELDLAHPVVADGGRPDVLRLDRVEVDARRARDLRDREDDARHVLAVRHRLREAEEVRDLDRRRLRLMPCGKLPRLDLRLGVRDLTRDRRRLLALRRDDQRVRGKADQPQPDHDQRDLDLQVDGGELLLHEVAPGGRTLAEIVNWTTLRFASFALVLVLSVTSVRSGTTSRRARKRATASCE